jgi:hypothetical protein
LNEDPAVPGLRIPTVIAAEDGTNLPPRGYELDEAERSVAVVLADDEMVAEPIVMPAERQTWAQFVGDLWKQCQGSNHRFIPVQLSESAWPLDQRLRETSFLRSLQRPEASRTSWTSRTLVVELCRFLQGRKRGEQLPMRLFLSHAKQDIEASPHLFKEIVSHLETTQPVKTWI